MHKNVMKWNVLLLLYLATISSPLFCQTDTKDQADRSSLLGKTTAIEDRAGGLHNVSNIGLFFENRGKLYPRRLTDGPSGEFPINSGRHYIYRINPMVAVAGDPEQGQKVNIIQGRFTENEEWEAAAGYRNKALAKVASSDNPKTWPVSGWPVKAADGTPLILSDQDSYCVYTDSNNTVKVLDLRITQTGYAYGVSFAEDLLFFKFDVVNASQQSYDSLYFAMYCDIDVGNISGGDPEYTDDKLDFIPEENCLYFYDADGYSAEWGGATGLFGVVMLATPKLDGEILGVTDMHWNLYYDDLDDDSLQFAILSSQKHYFPGNYSLEHYFHPGNLGTVHIDDPATIPVGGDDILANISSGPYNIAPAETLSFYTALVAGVDKSDFIANLEVAYKVYENRFQLPKPPSIPTLSAIAGDHQAILFWNDIAERSQDNFSGAYDFEGYRIYRSIDRGITWDQIDRNLNPQIGAKPVPLAEFDLINNFGQNTGLQYRFVDENVQNGFEYWYTITAFDRGDSLIESLESPIGRSLDAINTVTVISRSDPIGHLPVHVSEICHAGTGRSNYTLAIEPFDHDRLAGRQYNVSFTYTPFIDNGQLGTQMELIILDSTQTKYYSYGFEFTAADHFSIYNKTTNSLIRDYNYRTGVKYNLGDGLKIQFSDPDPDQLPQAGDYLSMNFSLLTICSTGDTVLGPRHFEFEKAQTTRDSVSFTIQAQPVIQNELQPTEDSSRLIFSVSNQDAILDITYTFIISAAGSENNRPWIDLARFYHASEGLVAIDTLSGLNNGDTFELNGLQAELEFNQSSAPAIGTFYSVSTLKPVTPNIQDVFSFTLGGASEEQDVIRSQLGNIKVVPNPYVVSSLWEQEFGELRMEPIRQIQFIHLPVNCTIKIFTLSGDLVKTIGHNSFSGIETWDLRADGGREITVGIYIYVVEAAGEKYLNRFAVIK
jgi:hypothetical protein